MNLLDMEYQTAGSFPASVDQSWLSWSAMSFFLNGFADRDAIDFRFADRRFPGRNRPHALCRLRRIFRGNGNDG